VVDRLRIFFNRPLHDGDRRRLFAIAVAVIIAAAGVLTLLDDVGPAPRPERESSGSVDVAPSSTAVALVPASNTGRTERGDRPTRRPASLAYRRRTQ
jgi:hypothetical protein